MKIGFFDSGLGGLTILSATRNRLPQFDYVYYGDTAHLPYGDRSEEDIFELTRAAMYHLFEKDAALIIIACNTASAETLRKLQDSILVGEYKDRRILGVIVPTIEELITENVHQVLLIGTNRTVASGKYERELMKHGAHAITLVKQATPELVPLIEANRINEAYEYIDSMLTPRIGEIDAVILGCTHYTVLKDHIREKWKNDLMVISQDEFIPEKLEAYLTKHTEIESRLTQQGTLEIELSKESDEYKIILEHLMNARE